MRPKGAWRAGFIACLARSGELDRCAHLNKVSDRAVRKARRDDPTFEADVRRALEAYERTRVEEALRRQSRYAASS